MEVPDTEPGHAGQSLGSSMIARMALVASLLSPHPLSGTLIQVRMSALDLFNIHLLLAFLVRSLDKTNSAGNDYLGAEAGTVYLRARG